MITDALEAILPIAITAIVGAAVADLALVAIVAVGGFHALRIRRRPTIQTNGGQA